MSEIRCPMCGRPNPADQEVCKFCQARLKPLVVKPFEGEGAPIMPGEPPVPGAPSDAEASLPDWLRDLRQKNAPGPGPEPEESQPDWQAEEVEGVSPTGEAGMEDSTGWMDRISQPGEGRPARGPERGVAETSGHPSDWLDSEGRDSPTEEREGELPDWLSGAGQPEQGAQEEASPPPSASQGAAEEGELPDWLAGLRQPEEVTGGEPPSASQGAAEEGELPDWLAGLRQPEQDAQEEASQPPAASQGAAEEGDLPDWLSRLAPTEQPADASVQDVPEWFAQEETGPEEAEPQFQEPAPEWLSGLEQEDRAISEQTIPLEPEAEGEAPALPLEEELPDWLKRLEASASEGSAGTSIPAFTVDEDRGAPLGLDDEPGIEALEGGVEGERGPETPSLSTLPEWLSQVSQEAEDSDTKPASEEQEAGLAPAQLPTWLEAMRPVEAAAPAAPVGEDLTSQVEKIGPLAGMRGVIPAEQVVGHLRKPPAYSVKLSLSESQNRSSVLLQKLLNSETEARPVPPRPVSASQAVLRLIIAVALFLVVLMPLWSQSQAVPLPDLASMPGGILEAVDLINSLPAGSLVLLAVDYEPGLSAEMEASAQAVVRSLNARGVSLVLVSTNPAGPVMAERLMSQVSGSPGGGSYVNLGFIAGGPAGMLRFAASPSATLPFDLRSDGQPPRSNLWEIEPLSRVRTAADFNMVVVLTENPDVAQDWIEQVGPALRPAQVPLVMAVSAQAEPMVRPYFEGIPQQVNGLIAGLQGGVNFENLTMQTGNARSYWDAFAWGLLVAVALILVGGLIAMLRRLLAPRKGSNVEGLQ